MNPFEGADFIKRKYDLHNASEVEAAAERSEKKEQLKNDKHHGIISSLIKKISHNEENKTEKDKDKFDTPESLIQNYLDRFSEITERRDEKKRLRGVDAFKHIIHDDYIMKKEEVPDSYWELQKRLAKEEGYGDIEISDTFKQELYSIIKRDQIASLDLWIDYLASPNAPFPMWMKYYVMRSVLSMGSYNVEQNTFSKRSKSTVHLFPDLNQEALAHVLDALLKKYNKSGKELNANDFVNEEEFKKLLQGENFSKLYSYAYDKCIPTSEEKFIGVEGEWVKYDKGGDHMPLVQSLKNRKTGWCTAGEFTAKTQLEGGDFYVFYSNDNEGNATIPRAAIRMQGDKIGEVRGIGVNQNLDSEIAPVVERKLKEFHDGDLYKKKVSNMKELTFVYNKVQKGEALTKDELIFLYERNSKIQGFGWRQDPRIKELLKKRDKIGDYSIIYDCPKDRICDDPTKVTEMTKIFVGKLEFGNRHFDDRVGFMPLNEESNYYYNSLNKEDYKVLDHRKSPIIIETNVRFDDTPIETLPNGIMFKKYAYFRRCRKLNSLPERMVVDGAADFSNTLISKIPSDAIFKKSVSFENCMFLTSIPRDMVFPAAVDFSHTSINSIPVSVEFGGKVSFVKCMDLKSIPANSLFVDDADFSGSSMQSVPEFAIFEGKALFDNCHFLTSISESVKFNDVAVFTNSGITSIPTHAEFNDSADFNSCKSLRSIPIRAFEHKVNFSLSNIDNIPADVIFNDDVNFYACRNLSSVSVDAKFNKGADFRGCEKLVRLPANIVFNGPADFGMCISLDEIPYGASFKGKTGFSSCVKLQRIAKKVIFENDVDFSDCISLMTISPDVIFNGNVSFAGCKSLTNLTKEMLKKMKEEGRIKGELKL